MKTTILQESGYELALRGMAYSYKDRAVPVAEWWGEQFPKARKRAPLLADKDGGHNKFLESITVWMDIEAPRAFWQEFDTYRVGTTKQSESTMHTLAKRPPTPDDFEEGTLDVTIQAFLAAWIEAKGDITILKENLPEGFLQRRMVVTNYKTLRNIIAQRAGHRYKRWSAFVEDVLGQVAHPEFLVQYVVECNLNSTTGGNTCTQSKTAFPYPKP